jgi:hypothetical protein
MGSRGTPWVSMSCHSGNLETKKAIRYLEIFSLKSGINVMSTIFRQLSAKEIGEFSLKKNVMIGFSLK